MKKFLLLLYLICHVVQAQFPPENPHLVNSPFPAVHNGSYRQGNTSLPAFGPGDTLKVAFAETPKDRVSPWLLYSEPYPNGQYTIWGSTSTHIFKAISTKNEFRVVSDYQIDKNPWINDLSWSFLMLPDHQVLTYDDNHLFLFGEEDISDPKSKIVLLKKMTMPKSIKSLSKLCRLYDGSIAFAARDGLIGVIDAKDFTLKATYQIPLKRGEKAYHNDYAVDDNGNLFISTTHKMISIQWNGKTVVPKWEVSMDFGGNRFQGIGTTPTLLGSGNGDKLVCVVDSQKPARMLSFWRDEIPTDWKGLKDFDKRVAAVTILPGSRPARKFMAAVENSPTAFGYGIACAQYNGFLGQSCDTKKGVYKLEWRPATNTMDLIWYRDDINLNNVLVYSTASNAIYGSGKENDCNYYYYSLDWDTGKTMVRKQLGTDKRFDDPGDANIVGPDRSITYNSKKCLVRIRPE
ncbi:hypothetical protein [Costertonia aggregata]|uniref:Uncharacterized protein n=1 Tax=Costertonia aggregata TaxID=343403 RepID=A0A7H9APM5_9FLAO|nr:hypothetical protein [Costertonia aggregata]QLG45376.1 hypothetical protein HYG79_08455 [Costertonia aggregata]